MDLTLDNVQKIFQECSENKKDDYSYTIVVRGILTDYKFKKDVIIEHENTINNLLLQMDERFLKTTGTLGWTFLDAGLRKDGTKWTEDYCMMEMLVVLGIAANLVELKIDREQWPQLSGGKPYFVIKNK